MKVITEINSATEATRNFRAPKQTHIPDGQPVRPAPNSVQAMQEMGLFVPGRSDDVEIKVSFPDGSADIYRVRPVERIIFDRADDSTTVFTAFYPDQQTLRSIYDRFSQ